MVKKTSVFLDSNFIDKNQTIFNSSLLETLAAYSQNELIELSISELVLFEIKKHALDKYKKSYSQINRNIDFLNKLCNQEITLDINEEYDYENLYDDLTSKFLTKHNIGIVKCKLSLEDLVNDALNKNPPFIDSENTPGITDYLIVKSYHNLIKSKKLCNPVIISNDNKVIEYCDINSIESYRFVNKYLNSESFQKVLKKFEKDIDKHEYEKYSIDEDKMNLEIEENFVEELLDFISEKYNIKYNSYRLGKLNKDNEFIKINVIGITNFFTIPITLIGEKENFIENENHNMYEEFYFEVTFSAFYAMDIDHKGYHIDIELLYVGKSYSYENYIYNTPNNY